MAGHTPSQNFSGRTPGYNITPFNRAVQSYVTTRYKPGGYTLEQFISRRFRPKRQHFSAFSYHDEMVYENLSFDLDITSTKPNE